MYKRLESLFEEVGRRTFLAGVLNPVALEWKIKNRPDVRVWDELGTYWGPALN